MVSISVSKTQYIVILYYTTREGVFRYILYVYICTYVQSSRYQGRGKPAVWSSAQHIADVPSHGFLGQKKIQSACSTPYCCHHPPCHPPCKQYNQVERLCFLPPNQSHPPMHMLTQRPSTVCDYSKSVPCICPTSASILPHPSTLAGAGRV